MAYDSTGPVYGLFLWLSVGVELAVRLLGESSSARTCLDGKDMFGLHLKTFLFASHWCIQHISSLNINSYLLTLTLQIVLVVSRPWVIMLMMLMVGTRRHRQSSRNLCMSVMNTASYWPSETSLERYWLLDASVLHLSTVVTLTHCVSVLSAIEGNWTSSRYRFLFCMLVLPGTILLC